ncbi:g1297 [Coccomyxa elongata]
MLLLLYELTMLNVTIEEGGNARRRGKVNIRQDQLRVTTPKNFWAAVELTAERGALSAPALHSMTEEQKYGYTWPPHKHDEYLPEPASLKPVHTDSTLGEVPVVSLDSIAGSVVVLPQIVPALRNNTPRRPLTLKYRDPFSWDLETLHSMLAAFFHASATSSIPPLEEYTKLPDKMYLQEAYENYHAEDPVLRVPPIPTVKLSAPGMPKEHSLLCYTDCKYTATESHIDAIMKTIYLGLVKMDAMIPPDSEIRAVQRPLIPLTAPSVAQEHDVESEERAFIIKRNLSNAATHVLTVRVPDWLLEQACLTHASNWSSVHPCLDGGMAPWRAGPSLALSDDLSTGTQQTLLKHFAPQPLTSVFFYITARKWLERDIVAVGMLELMLMQAVCAVSTPGYLRKAAEVLAKESCGEPWLLQPKIRDMESLEYRVYLLGGANASGQPNDTVVYYVYGDVAPSDNSGGQRRGLGAISYMALAPGYFWSDSLFPPGWSEEAYTPHSTMEPMKDAGSAAAPHPDAAAEAPHCGMNGTMPSGSEPAEQEVQYIEVYEGESPRLQWHHPDLYDTLVQAALDNVRAVAASSLQRSSARDVFARADVVLAWYTNGRDTHLVPLINEISLLNSASKLISFWNPHREPNHWPLQVQRERAAATEHLSTEQQIRSGWGLTLAKAMAEAVVTSYLTELRCTSCNYSVHAE